MAEKNSQSDTMGEGDSIEDLKLKVAELETSRAKLRQALVSFTFLVFQVLFVPSVVLILD